MMSDDSKIVSQQYAEYLKVDLDPGTKAVEECIDETLIRLEEYSSLIDMVRADPSVEICRSILRNKAELEQLFEKVRKLEAFVQRVKQDVEKVEELVLTAESDLGISTEGKLRSLLRPFLKRSNSLPRSSTQSRNQTTFTPPELFKTQDFFSTEK